MVLRLISIIAILVSFLFQKGKAQSIYVNQSGHLNANGCELQFLDKSSQIIDSYVLKTIPVSVLRLSDSVLVVNTETRVIILSITDRITPLKDSEIPFDTGSTDKYIYFDYKGDSVSIQAKGSSVLAAFKSPSMKMFRSVSVFLPGGEDLQQNIGFDLILNINDRKLYFNLLNSPGSLFLDLENNRFGNVSYVQKAGIKDIRETRWYFDFQHKQIYLGIKKSRNLIYLYSFGNELPGPGKLISNKGYNVYQDESWEERGVGFMKMRTFPDGIFDQQALFENGKKVAIRIN